MQAPQLHGCYLNFAKHGYQGIGIFTRSTKLLNLLGSESHINSRGFCVLSDWFQLGTSNPSFALKTFKGL